MAYVAVSRGRYDAQIYTNDKSELAQHLSRDISQRTALDNSEGQDHHAGQKIAPESAGHEHGRGEDMRTPAHGQGQSAGEPHGYEVGQE
jgi:hypothetical protein